jgi:DMSO/TMAO reductase YedYZ molybdopterin-dependent catalytic subunit
MKKLSLLVILLVITALLFGCTSQTAQPAPQPPAEPDWEIVIEGVTSSPITFTSIDAEKLQMVEIEVILRKRDGSEEKQNWKGIPLKAVLEAVGAKDYKGVIVEAADGYAKEYTLEITNRAETILGLELNGSKLDDSLGPVQMVPKGEMGNMFIKNLSKITVIK